MNNSRKGNKNFHIAFFISHFVTNYAVGRKRELVRGCHPLNPPCPLRSPHFLQYPALQPSQKMSGNKNNIYSPLDIARYFLAKSEETPVKGLTPMQIIKLVYIAHGWSLGMQFGSLIDNSEKSKAIQAWPYGPVVEMLYHVFKWRGRKIVEWDYLTRPLGEQVPQPAAIERVQDAKALLEFIWNRYGHRSGWYLSALTHQEGTPWDIVIKNNRDQNDRRKDLHIPNFIIQEHYEKIILELINKKNQDGQ